MPGAAVVFLSRFCHVCSLWAFGSLGDLELYLIAFLQALVSFSGYRAVVHENIRSTVASDEAIPFGIVEPFHRTIQTFHVTPSGTHFCAEFVPSTRPFCVCRWGLSRVVTIKNPVYGELSALMGNG
jgi:hypothetical protein